MVLSYKSEHKSWWNTKQPKLYQIEAWNWANYTKKRRIYSLGRFLQFCTCVFSCSIRVLGAYFVVLFSLFYHHHYNYFYILLEYTRDKWWNSIHIIIIKSMTYKNINREHFIIYHAFICNFLHNKGTYCPIWIETSRTSTQWLFVRV